MCGRDFCIPFLTPILFVCFFLSTISKSWNLQIHICMCITLCWWFQKTLNCKYKKREVDRIRIVICSLVSRCMFFSISIFFFFIFYYLFDWIKKGDVYLQDNTISASRHHYEEKVLKSSPFVVLYLRSLPIFTIDKTITIHFCTYLSYHHFLLFIFVKLFNIPFIWDEAFRVDKGKFVGLDTDDVVRIVSVNYSTYYYSDWEIWCYYCVMKIMHKVCNVVPAMHQHQFSLL